MYDPKTRRIRISCDLRWMGKFYNDGLPIEIPNYNKNNSKNIKLILPPIRYDDVEKEINRTRHTLIEKKIPENPTMNDLPDVILVGRTNESNKSPVPFNDAWYNKNSELRLKWREAINKEFKNIARIEQCMESH